MAKNFQYSLYQTFDNNIPDYEIDIDKKKRIVEKVDNLSRNKKVAFLRLILEHYILNNDFSKEQYRNSDTNDMNHNTILSTIETRFPYATFENSKLNLPPLVEDLNISSREESLNMGDLNFDFNNFDKKLQWILWRFFEISSEELIF